MLIFVISWQGQHESAVNIAEQLSKTGNSVTIVYSDPDPDFVFNAPCQLIRRSNELFWEDKFKACLDAADHDGMLVIHADCDCEDWSLLVIKCNDATRNINNIGVWAPKIDGTPWSLSVSRILDIDNTDLVISALTDGLVFYLSPDVVKRMKQVEYGNNKFGWGIDGLFCATSYVINKLVVIDKAVHVFHPEDKRGYDEASAKVLKQEFLRQFSLSELLQYELLTNHVMYNYAKLIR